ncbi:MAG: glycosyltransferase family 4 protein [Melioribacteraceae bacterium]
MNIAVFLPNIKPVCGRTNMGISLVKGLNRKGVSVSLITNPESDLTLLPKLEIKTLVIPCNPENKSLLSFLKSITALNKFIKENKIEIVNTHHRYCEFISISTRFIFDLDYKISTTVHSFTNNLKAISYRADRLIAVSSFIKYHLIKYYSKKDSLINVIYNAVEEELNLHPDQKNYEKYILGFGRLDYEKGFDILIQTLIYLKDKITLPKLILIGEGSEENRLRQLAEQNNIKVEFLKSDSTPWETIKNSLFVVVPSREESLGLVILEAGLMGKAVIASNVGGIPEIIDDDKSGLLFENGNYFQLAELLNKLIINKTLAEQFGLDLKQKIGRQFSYNQMIEDYISVFNDL